MYNNYEKLDLEYLKEQIINLKNSRVDYICDNIDDIIEYIENCENTGKRDEIMANNNKGEL